MPNLFDVIKSSDSRLIQKLLSQGANVNARDENGFTPLFIAALNYDSESFMILINNGADIKALSPNGWSLEQVLAYHITTHDLEELLEKELNFHLEGPKGIFPIQLAVRSNNVIKVKWFINNGLVTRPLDYLDLLHYAVEDNTEKIDAEFKNDQDGENVFLYQTVVSKYLIEEHNLDVNTKNLSNWTPLHLAAKSGNIFLMKLLLWAGADPDVPGDNDQTPMYMAISGGHLEAVKLLESRGVLLKDTSQGSEFCPMRLAAQNGHIHIIKYLMEQGIDHLKDDNQIDLISCAAEHLQLHVIKWYFEQGVDIKRYIKNFRSSNESKLDLEILKWLQSIGFDFTQVLGPVPLMHIATSEGRTDIMEYLKSQGVDLNCPDDQGTTAVHRAARYGQIEVLRYLNSQNADLNKENKNGQTPIFDAIQGGYFAAISYLAEKGADLTKKDKDGNTLMHIAARDGKIAVIQWLLDHHLTVDSLNNDDESPLDVVFGSNLADVKVLKLLEANGALITAGEIEEMESDIFYHKDTRIALKKPIRVELIDWLKEHNVQNNFIDNFILSLIYRICIEGRIDKLEVVEKFVEEFRLTEENIQDLVKYAAMHKKSIILKWLMDRGINIEKAIFEIEDTPYNINCQIIAAKWINQYGIGCHISDDVEGKLFEHFIKYNNLKVIELIRDVKESGVTVSLPQDTDQNLILNAAASGDIELIKKLYLEGADLNELDSKGNTSLHHAIKALDNNFEAIKFLIENGVNLNIANNKGDSPLKLAIASKKYEVVLLLCSLQVKINVEDGDVRDFFLNKEDFDKTFMGDDLVCQKKAILHLISSFEGTITYSLFGLGQILENKASQIKADMEDEDRDVSIKHGNTLESLEHHFEQQGEGAFCSIDLNPPKHIEEVEKDIVGSVAKIEPSSCCCVIS